MTRDDLFNINAGIVKNLVTAAAKHCPEVRPAAGQQQHTHTQQRKLLLLLSTHNHCRRPPHEWIVRVVAAQQPNQLLYPACLCNCLGVLQLPACVLVVLPAASPSPSPPHHHHHPHPQAIIEIISNPVNSTVPIASEVLKAAGVCVGGEEDRQSSLDP